MPILAADKAVKPDMMQGFSLMRRSQATMNNYREHLFNQWIFRNAGAPLNVVMTSRANQIKELLGPTQSGLANFTVSDVVGKTMGLDTRVAANYADGLVVVQGDELLH
jgi:hypothetical protein